MHGVALYSWLGWRNITQRFRTHKKRELDALRVEAAVRSRGGCVGLRLNPVFYGSINTRWFLGSGVFEEWLTATVVLQSDDARP